MLEMTIKIEATSLAAAIEKLAAAISSPMNTGVPMPPAAAPVPAPIPVSAPAPIPTAAPPAMPTSVPGYTLEQISKAGAALVDAGKMEPLMALLGKYGIQAITQLPPDQYGVFATELRALGAQI